MELDFEMGMKLGEMHNTKVGIGLIIGFFTVHAVLLSQHGLAKLPPDYRNKV